MVTNNNSNGNSRIIGTNVFPVFMNSDIQRFVKTTGYPHAWHKDSYGKINAMGDEIILIGNKLEAQTMEGLAALWEKDNNLVTLRFYQEGGKNFSSGAEFMTWLEELPEGKRLDTLEAWFLLPPNEAGNEEIPIEPKMPAKPKAKVKVAAGEKPLAPKATKSVKNQEVKTDDGEARAAAPGEDEDVITTVGKKEKEQLLADLVVNHYGGNLLYDKSVGCFRLWNGHKWNQVHPVTVKRYIMKILDDNQQGYSNSRLNSVISMLQSQLDVDSWDEKDRGSFIFFKDCVLEIESGKVADHDRDNRNNYSLPYTYSPVEVNQDVFTKDIAVITEYYVTLGEQIAPDTLKTYSQWQHGDHFRIFKLLCMANAVLKCRLSYLNYFIYLLGKPRTGKGSFIRHLTAMVGKDNYASCSADRLNNDYNIAQFIDKLLIACPDEDVIQRVSLAAIRKLTGRDLITFRQIYKEVANAICQGSLIIAANQDIMGSRATAISERTCFIDFNDQVPVSERDPYLNQKLEKELSAFVSLVLSIPDDLVEEFIRGIRRGENQELDRTQWETQTESDSIKAWLDENIDFDSASFVGIGKANSKDYDLAYPNYVRFSQEENFSKEKINLNEFSKRVIEEAAAQGKEIIKHRTNSGYVLLGMKIKEKTAQPTQSTQPSHSGDSSNAPIKLESTQTAPSPETTEKSVDSSAIPKLQATPMKPLSDKDSVDRADRVDLLPTFSKENKFLFNEGDIVRLKAGCTTDNCWVVQKRSLEGGTKPTYYICHQKGKYPSVEKYEDSLEKITCQIGLFS